jgi:hypothetical protein
VFFEQNYSLRRQTHTCFLRRSEGRGNIIRRGGESIKMRRRCSTRLHSLAAKSAGQTAEKREEAVCLFAWASTERVCD